MLITCNTALRLLNETNESTDPKYFFNKINGWIDFALMIKIAFVLLKKLWK